MYSFNKVFLVNHSLFSQILAILSKKQLRKQLKKGEKTSQSLYYQEIKTTYSKEKTTEKKSIILQIKNKFAIIGKPSRNQLIIISIISFTAYFISNSMETLIITFLYLCLIYAVSLIYLAYVETKKKMNV